MTPQVDEVVDSMLTLVPPRVWEEFYAAFESRVAALTQRHHWYYNKAQSKI